MSAIIRNPQKIALRRKIKELLKLVSKERVASQSASITRKIIASPVFQKAQRISIYLSLDTEVNTTALLLEMFRLNKQVFVPSYSGNRMVMLKISGIDDYEALPLTKWNIRQPSPDDGRENSNDSGGLDLILMPGVAFSRTGGRLGHGMGYYDKCLKEMFNANPQRLSSELRGQLDAKLNTEKTILMGLALEEQIVPEIPLDEHDYLLDEIITTD